MALDAKQAEAIFFAALDKKAGTERSGYLAEACGDDAELRNQIDALLHAHEHPESFLDFPAVEDLSQTIIPNSSEELLSKAGIGDTQTVHPSAEFREENTAYLSPSSKPGSLGRLGHYEILEIVGQGGMGVVLRAFDELLHRVVAIKVMAPELAVSGTARQRFIREARAAAPVAHEHVISIHGVETEGSVPYIVMQFVEGTSLDKRIQTGGALPLKEILRIGLQIAEGLAAAHKHGLVHRDIKPANILLENGVEKVKITDFGLARAVDDASLTQSGVITGTPMYMSPEQADGQPLDHRSDLFSLGSVLYAMCTGRPPFRAGSTVAVLKRVCDETPRPVRELNPEIPDWLEAIIAKLQAKRPEDRFQSAKEVAELLAQHLAHLQQPERSPMPAKLERSFTKEATTVHRRSFLLPVLIMLCPLFLIPVVLACAFVAGLFPWLLFLLAIVAGGSVTLIGLVLFVVRVSAAPKPIVARPRNRNRRRRLAIAATLAVLVFAAAAWFGPPLYLLAQGNGEVSLEANDPGVRIEGDFPTLEANSGQIVELPAGRYQAHVVVPENKELGVVSFHYPDPWYPFRSGDRLGSSNMEYVNLEVMKGRKVRIHVLVANRQVPKLSPEDQRRLSVAGTWESAYGEVTLQHAPFDEMKPVPVSAAYANRDGVKRIITGGTLDPAKMTLDVKFLDPETNTTGTASLRLSSDGQVLTGTWTNSASKTGAWTLSRRPDSGAGDQRSDEEKLQGEWAVTCSEMRVPGSAIGDGVPPPNVTFRGNIVHAVGLIGDGTYKLDAHQVPKEIDVTLKDEDKPLLGIYQLGQDRLSICLAGRGEPRPTTFEIERNATGILLALRHERPDDEKLQGTWRAVSFELEGAKQDLTADKLKLVGDISLTFEHDKVRQKHTNITGPLTLMQGPFHLDTHSKPKRITVDSTKPKSAFYGIYWLDGDVLKICQFNDPAKINQFPTEFTGKKGSGTILVVYHRAKAGDIDRPMPPLVIGLPNQAGPAGFRPLFNGRNLAGWKKHPDQPGNWRVDNGILIGSGPSRVSHLFSERGDYANFHLRAEAKINKAGNSGIYFRTPYGLNRLGMYPAGYEAQIFVGDKAALSDNPEPQKTGSLFNFVPYTKIPPGAEADQWFTMEIIAREHRITIKVNDTVTVDNYVDRNLAFFSGHIALQQVGPQTVVQFRKIEIKELPLEDVAPPKPASPFVILSNKEQAEQAFESLAQAMGMAHSGDTIEIRGSGPFVTKSLRPLDGKSKALTIRAAAGFQPVIQLRDEDARLGEPLIWTDAALALEGLRLERINHDKVWKPGMKPHVTVWSAGAPLYVANCQFNQKGGMVCILADREAPLCDIRNCAFLTPDSAVWWPSTSGGRLSMENCVHNGFHSAVVDYRAPAHDVSVKLKRNTFVANEPLVFELIAAGQARLSSPSVKPVSFELYENVLCSEGLLFHFNQSAEFLANNKELRFDEAKDLLRALVAWREERNAYSPEGSFGGWSKADHGDQNPWTRIGEVKTLDDWQQFWGLKETGSIYQSARTKTEDFFARVRPGGELVEPRAFRLQQQSPGYQKGPGGRDLGADVDLVGPGAAYERWKTTPDYLEWRKTTTEHMK